jgi:predicted oxidoreductase
VQSSLLGTKGGPRTDREGRVLNVDGDVISGLFAAGNVMANPTGMVYGGAGATLAVATVFGMLAGRAAVLDQTVLDQTVLDQTVLDQSSRDPRGNDD